MEPVVPVPSILDELRIAPRGSIVVDRDPNGAPVRLGHGGQRGSSVYLIRCSGTQRALKSCVLNLSEAALCRRLQQCVGIDPEERLEGCPGDGLESLAIPLYIAVEESFASPQDARAVSPAGYRDVRVCMVGVVMPYFDFSLQRLLADPAAIRVAHIMSPPDPRCVDSGTGHRIATPSSPRSYSSIPATETSGSDDEDSAFRKTRRQRAVTSAVVVAALLRLVVKAISFLHSLSHFVGEAPCLGFAHQDIRADNILISRNGAVVVCDFELVGHFRSSRCGPSPREVHDSERSRRVLSASSDMELQFVDDHVTCRSGSRIIPAEYHAPEGPNMLKCDEWLIGLLAVELFTGVSPLIRKSVATNDFGPGPLLEVNPTNGIGWQAIERHLTEHLNAPWASDAAPRDPILVRYCVDHGVDYTVAQETIFGLLRDFCQKCMENDPDRRASVEDLARHPLFAYVSEITGGSPQSAVKEWIAQTLHAGGGHGS